MIKTHENQFSVGRMCRMLSVSRIGYYSWKDRPPSSRDQANRILAAEIKRVFDDEKGWTGRGSQYCSVAYQKLFHQHQLICSTSKKGDCYDNAGIIALR